MPKYIILSLIRILIRFLSIIILLYLITIEFNKTLSIFIIKFSKFKSKALFTNQSEPFSLCHVEKCLVMTNNSWQVQNTSSFYQLKSRLIISSSHVVMNQQVNQRQR